MTGCVRVYVVCKQFASRVKGEIDEPAALAAYQLPRSECRVQLKLKA